MKIVLLASVASVVTAPVAFMSDACETVTVVSEDGKSSLIINKSDYDADQAEGGAKKFKLHKAQEAQTGPGIATVVLPPHVSVPPAPGAPDFTVAPVATDAGAPTAVITDTDQRLVANLGTAAKPRYFVVTAGPVDDKGAATFPKVENVDQIDAKGYGTEKEAWDAILAEAKARPTA